jgi:hypothetical protein
VFIVRQELFEVRDALWDAVRSLDSFSDPAYLQTRATLNAMIHSAHKFNLPVFIYLTKEFRAETESTRSNSPEVQQAIDQAIGKAAFVLARYIVFYRPFSALASVLNLMIKNKTRKIIDSVRDRIARWMKDDGPGRLEALAGAT